MCQLVCVQPISVSVGTMVQYPDTVPPPPQQQGTEGCDCGVHPLVAQQAGAGPMRCWSADVERYVTFGTLGMGTNYLVPVALFLQVRTQPSPSLVVRPHPLTASVRQHQTSRPRPAAQPHRHRTTHPRSQPHALHHHRSAVPLLAQLPLFSRLPEGIRLASRMNLAVNVVPICISFFYVVYRSRPDHCRRPQRAAARAAAAGPATSFRRDALVVVLLCGNVAAATLAAVGWQVVVDGTSLVLYFACALAGTVGSMSAVVLMPWVSRHSADLIPAVNTGGAGSMLLLALLDAAEGPGEAHPRFGASTFFAICAALSVLPLIAYAAIHCRQPTRRAPTADGRLRGAVQLQEAPGMPASGRSSGKPVTREITTLQPDPSCSSAATDGTAAAGVAEGDSVARRGGGAAAPPACAPPPPAHAFGEAVGTSAAASLSSTREVRSGVCTASGAGADGLVVVLEDARIDAGGSHAAGQQHAAPTNEGKGGHARAPRSLWHYCALNFTVNLVCWGMQPALIPLAVRHATAHGASEGPPLQMCTMASALCVTMGHLSSACLRSRRLNLLTLAYATLATVFMLAAFDVGVWASTYGSVAVVLLVAASRLLDGMFTSLLSLEICETHDRPELVRRKEHMLRVAGLAGSAGTLLGSVLAAKIVPDDGDGNGEAGGGHG